MIDVEIEDPAWTQALPDAEALVRVAAMATLKALHPGSAKDERSVTVLLTDDETVRDLNARFRQQDKPTNVLSFPAPANPQRFLGDVALAYGVCAREAVEQAKPLADHLRHLVAHGVLHLLGYDHISDDEALAMEGLERAILAGLGIADPYEAR